MILDGLIRSIGNAQRIAIVGRPGVGKTTIAKKMAEVLGTNLYHTDDYIDRTTFEDAPKAIIADLANADRYIVEGVQVARMLRTGQRENIWRPDCVVLVRANIAGQPKHKSMTALVSKALQEWLSSGPVANRDSLHVFDNHFEQGKKFPA